jgi:hypothetical protein
VFDDVNDLYTDEHLIMTQADLLEQMYSNYLFKEGSLVMFRYCPLNALAHKAARSNYQ